MPTSKKLFLIGFSTTGKSQVGEEVARRLGCKFVDTDEEVASVAGKPISAIFSEDGEERFRELEKWALQKCSMGDESIVISTGGGTVVDPQNRTLMFDCGVVICLEARPDTIYRRLKKDTEDSLAANPRPLLSGDDPLRKIETLKQTRQPFYALADWTVHTDSLTVDEVTEEVLRGLKYAQKRFDKSGAVPANNNELTPSFTVNVPSGDYPVYVGLGILSKIGTLMKKAGLKNAAYVITDSNVQKLHSKKVMDSLKGAGFAVDCYAVSAGETSKDIDEAVKIYDWLVKHKAERGHAIVALGGGVVGDLAGYVAATYLRGLPLVQAPTSLLAMTDSAIGGKTGVNRPEAKNLVGAFYQPRMVISDVQTLTTLSKRHYVEGWAETIKHAITMDPELFELLEKRTSELLALEPEITTEVIKRSSALKGNIVAKDERETLGLREILNYGHTIGHGIEAATGYETFLHGEAVSIGMMAAANIGLMMGVTSQGLVARQQALLREFGLPLFAPGVSQESIRKAMALDKKVSNKTLKWILLNDLGKTVTRNDVPSEVVDKVIQTITHESAKG
ncbi:MAG: 3-dehydroquinate synthase [Dehalococcoidia bacterium]|nr:3-dehydroquinate synthase [Dehalococcoidia bacterium]